MVFILDAVNQLPNEYHSLYWLPYTLPENVHFVISALWEGDIQQAVERRKTSKYATEGSSDRKSILLQLAYFTCKIS